MSTFKSYLTGFLLSIAFTLGAYFAVTNQLNSALPIILGLAFLQLVVQIFFFLHVHKGADRIWNSTVLISTLGVVFILIAGSIWIMTHLNYHMTPMQMQEHVIKDEGIHK